jgi:acetolactate synthase I/II/III large subunit
MARMTGGRALVEMLCRHGVDTLFALPGVQNDALFVALYDAGDKIRVIHPRHEQAAAYMAFGYARASGKIGAYAVVPGPGAQYDGGARYRLRDQFAGLVHIGADPVQPDRPRLWPPA